MLLGASGVGDGRLLHLSQRSLPKREGLQLVELLKKDPQRGELLGGTQVWLNPPGSLRRGCGRNTSTSLSLFSAVFIHF